MRTRKGHSIDRYIENYSIVDLETTGIFSSENSIIEIAAIKIRNGDVVDEFCTLINPQHHIPESATAINNITDDMVNDAPTISDIIDAFISFIGDDVIVGYNIAGYDINILYDKLMVLRGKPFSNNYLDVMHAAYECYSKSEPYIIETLT